MLFQEFPSLLYRDQSGQSCARNALFSVHFRGILLRAFEVALYSVHFRGVFAMEMAFFDLGIKSDPEKCDLRKKSDP